MKKIILSLIISLFSIVAFAQSFAKSKTVQIGVKNETTGKFDFQEPQEIPAVLVKMGDIEIIIYSKVEQKYFIYSETYDFDDGNGSYWYAYDAEGNKVRIYLYKNPVSEIFLGIEYGDVCWVYTLNSME